MKVDIKLNFFFSKCLIKVNNKNVTRLMQSASIFGRSGFAFELLIQGLISIFLFTPDFAFSVLISVYHSNLLITAFNH